MSLRDGWRQAVFQGHTGAAHAVSFHADGTVVPCCMHPQAGSFGNLKTQKYSEILASRERREFKQALDTGRAKMSICGTCDVGPAGNEGPSFWSAITYWSPNKAELPEKVDG